MRRFLITSLALLLVLTNTLMVADVHAEAFSGRHSPDVELHAGEHGDSGENHAQCHHCCHAQGHFSSLLQHSNAGWSIASSHDWAILEASQPHQPGHAPPVPPPKA